MFWVSNKNHLYVAIFIKEDIVQFKVTINNFIGMEKKQAKSNFCSIKHCNRLLESYFSEPYRIRLEVTRFLRSESNLKFNKNLTRFVLKEKMVCLKIINYF